MNEYNKFYESFFTRYIFRSDHLWQKHVHIWKKNAFFIRKYNKFINSGGSKRVYVQRKAFYGKTWKLFHSLFYINHIRPYIYVYLRSHQQPFYNEGSTPRLCPHRWVQTSHIHIPWDNAFEFSLSLAKNRCGTYIIRGKRKFSIGDWVSIVRKPFHYRANYF